MKVKALRGVCIGVGSHLAAGDTADLEPALVTYLSGIGAVVAVADEPIPEPAAAPEPQPTTTKDPEAPAKDKDPVTQHAPGKSGKKEK